MARGKYETELMFKLVDRMKSASDEVDGVYNNLKSHLEDNQWDDEVGKKFKDEVIENIENLIKFSEQTKILAEKLNERAKELEKTLQA